MGCAAEQLDVTKQIPWIRVVDVERDRAAYAQIIERARAIGPIRNEHTIYWLLAPVAEAKDEERAWVVLLDTHGYLRGVHQVAQGARDHVAISLPDGLRAAVVSGARYLVLVHNHPTGDARPSVDDGRLTQDMGRAASTVDLVLLDHVVIGFRQYYSFKGKALWKL